jgi:hypothetical protein
MTLKADALPGDVDLEAWKKLSTSVMRPKKVKSKK